MFLKFKRIARLSKAQPSNPNAFFGYASLAAEGKETTERERIKGE